MSSYDQENRQTVRRVFMDYAYAIDDDVAEGLRNPPNTVVNPAAVEFASIRALAVVYAVERVQSHFDHLKAACKAGRPI